MILRIARYIDIYIGIPLLYFCYWAKKYFRFGFVSNTLDGYNKILLIKFWGIGNIAMLLPAALALKAKYGNAELDFLTLPNSRGILKAAKIFDNVYTMEYENIIKFISATINNFRILRNKDYDLIIDFEQFARLSSLFCLLAGRKKTIGFNTRGQHRHFVYTSSVLYDNDIHMTRSFYSLLEPIGIGEVPEIKLPSIACEKSDISCVENILHQKGIKKEEILVIMHTGTSENFTERRWPAEYYADLADRLIEAFGVKIAFTGIKDEIPYIEEARKGIKNVGSTIDLGGDLSFGRYLSLISVSDLVISADTASVHLAACFSVPVAGLYGPNTPLLYGPWGGNGIWFYKKLACSPCITNYNSKLNRCRHPDGCGACMKKITVDEVFLAIRKNYFDTDAPFRIRKLHE